MQIGGGTQQATDISYISVRQATLPAVGGGGGGAQSAGNTGGSGGGGAATPVSAPRVGRTVSVRAPVDAATGRRARRPCVVSRHRSTAAIALVAAKPAIASGLLSTVVIVFREGTTFFADDLQELVAVFCSD